MTAGDVPPDMPALGPRFPQDARNGVDPTKEPPEGLEGRYRAFFAYCALEAGVTITDADLARLVTVAPGAAAATSLQLFRQIAEFCHSVDDIAALRCIRLARDRGLL